MPEIIQNIYDYDGKVVYPITKISAIVGDDGEDLEGHIKKSVQKEVDRIIDTEIPSNKLFPVGGKTGQIIVKNSDSDYDVSWVNAEFESPITKVVGTIQNPIILSELTSGIYRIVGNNYIVRNDPTCYVDASGSNLYIRSEVDNNIIKVTSKNITIYTFTNEGYTTNKYVTQEDIASIKADIISNMPTKLSQLTNDCNFVSSTDMTNAINEKVSTEITEQLNNGKIGEFVDKKISDAYGPIPDEDIANLFK